MSRLQCVGKSSKGSQKQLALEVTTAHAETYKSDGTVGRKTVTDKVRRTLPSSHSVQERQESGFVRGDVLHLKESAPKQSVTIIPRVEKQAAMSVEDVKMKDPRTQWLSHSAVTGGKTHGPPPVEPIPPPEPHCEEEQTEEEDADDEGHGAPLQLMAEFLRAVMDGDFQLASKLCQMILIYEPENPEARQFLPLIQEKLLEEQEDQSNDDDDDDNDEDDEDDEDDNDDSDNSGSDEESTQSSSSSCSSSSSSSSSSSEEDEEAEQRGNRHKPCPPSNLPP